MAHEKDDISERLKDISPAMAEYSLTLKEMLAHESGQVVAIFSTSVFEEVLTRAIKLRFAKISRKISDQIFSNLNAPLSTLSSKINIAHALGLLDKTEHHDADLIRRIRNKFAHSTAPIGFDDAEIIELVEKLKEPKTRDEMSKEYLASIGVFNPPMEMSPRLKFVITTSLLSGFVCTCLDHGSIKQLGFAYGPYADQEKPSIDKP